MKTLMISFISKTDRLISKVEVLLVTCGVLLMAANSIANVVGRTFLEHSIYFSEELNQFLIIVVTFSGVSYAARHSRHIRMTALYDLLPQKPRKMLMLVICLVTASLMFFLSYQSFLYLLQQEALGRVSSALRFPLYMVYAWVPLGLFMTGCQYSMAAFQNVVRDGIYLSFHTKEILEKQSS